MIRPLFFIFHLNYEFVIIRARYLCAEMSIADFIINNKIRVDVICVKFSFGMLNYDVKGITHTHTYT